MNRNRLLWLVFIGVGMFSNVVSSSNVWAGAPKTAQIVFVAYGRDGNQADIYVMDINGGRQRNLTKHAIADEVTPAWSPDGRKIAFISNRDGNLNIYVMDADGNNIHQLTKAGILRKARQRGLLMAKKLPSMPSNMVRRMLIFM